MIEWLVDQGPIGWVVILGGVVPVFLIALLSVFWRSASVPGLSPLTGDAQLFEYTIRPEPGSFLALPRERYEETLRPRSRPSHIVSGWGDHRISAAGVEVAFQCEEDGVQVSFEGAVARAEAERIAGEIRESLAAATGQTLELVAR